MWILAADGACRLHVAEQRQLSRIEITLPLRSHNFIPATRVAPQAPLDVGLARLGERSGIVS
jgi:hypothetical protein